MSFWRLHYHMVWATARREPTISDARAGLIVRSMQATATELGTHVYAIGLMPDHVHVAIAIPPRIAIAEVARHLKGTSSKRVNDAGLSRELGHFSWQREYGVLSFGDASLDRIVDYVRNQREHHAADTIWPLLEVAEKLPSGEPDHSPGGASRP